MSASLQGNVDNGTPEQRFARLETENARRADEIRDVRAEIEQARVAALEEFRTLSDAVRLKDIYPGLFGLLVSIAGYVCQLIGQLR